MPPNSFTQNDNMKQLSLSHKRSVVFSILASAAALLLTTQITSADAVNEFTVPFDVTVDGPELPLVASPGICTEIDWPLTLVGMAHWVIHSSVKNGLVQFSFENGVRGTATDAAGNTFVFSYQNNFRSSFELILSQTVLDFDTDHFTMEGPAGNISIGFVGALLFDANGNFLGAVIDYSHGNVSCDPI
jgi:hypothetical protein